MTATLVLLPLLMLVAGLPIFVILMTTSIVVLAVFMGIPLAAVHQNLFGSLNSIGLLAIPYFIFAGDLMARGTISVRLVDFVRSLAGGMPGSLGVTTVGTATVFGAISGSSAAAVASVGRVLYPAMTNDGYPRPLSAGMVTSVSAIGIVIPPSIPMIVYGASSETSIPRLYAAGVFPGLLLALCLAAFVMFHANRNKYGSSNGFSFANVRNTSAKAAWALGAPIIVLGGIYGGIFSPTEAAAIACVYAIIVTRFILRELSWIDILDSAKASVIFSSQILMVVAAAGLFSWILAVNQVPLAMSQWFTENDVAAWQFLLAVNLILLIWGCFMDPISAILLLTPVLVPIVDALEIDKVHFGIIMTINLAVGLFTPPFGINIFVAQSALNIGTADIYRGVFPFLVIFLAVLATITFIPAISLLSAETFMFVD